MFNMFESILTYGTGIIIVGIVFFSIKEVVRLALVHHGKIMEHEKEYSRKVLKEEIDFMVKEAVKEAIKENYIEEGKNSY